MKKLILVFSIWYIVYGGILMGSVSAAESSKSATLIEKINALKAEVASKAASLKSEINKKLENKAYVGIVTQISSDRITIKSQAGTKTVIFNEYTAFQDSTLTKKTTKPKLETKDLKVDDYIAALGDVDDKESLVAKKVIKVKKWADTPSTFWGQITSIQSQAIVIQDRDGNKITISTTPQTVFNLGKEEASMVDVKITKYLAGVGGQIKDSKTDSSYIYLIPSSGHFKVDKPKVSSASATPSAKPKK